MCNKIVPIKCIHHLESFNALLSYNIKSQTIYYQQKNIISCQTADNFLHISLFSHNNRNVLSVVFAILQLQPWLCVDRPLSDKPLGFWKLELFPILWKTALAQSGFKDFVRGWRAFFKPSHKFLVELTSGLWLGHTGPLSFSSDFCVAFGCFWLFPVGKQIVLRFPDVLPTAFGFLTGHLCILLHSFILTKPPRTCCREHGALLKIFSIWLKAIFSLMAKKSDLIITRSPLAFQQTPGELLYKLF